MALFFVTDRSDAHVARFDALFATVTEDYEYVHITEGADGEPRATVSGSVCESWDELVNALSAPRSVVVSGPLDTVSGHLTEGDFRHIAISFATDVMVSATQSAEQLSRLRNLVPSLDTVVTDNYATENALVALGAQLENILRIPWGPDTLRSGKSLARTDCGWPEDKRVVLYPRSLEPHYDPLVFVAALEQVVSKFPDTLAVLVETGSLIQVVKQTLEQKGLAENVHFEPPRDPDTFRSMMALADAVVVTPRTDGTSVTVMDAMALGVPVVSSLTSGSAEWVMEGITGWTFPVGDVDALAAAIERALTSDPALKAEIVGQAKRLVQEKAGWDVSSQRLAEVIRRALAPH